MWQAKFLHSNRTTRNYKQQIQKTKYSGWRRYKKTKYGGWRRYKKPNMAVGADTKNQIWRLAKIQKNKYGGWGRNKKTKYGG